MRDWRNNQTTSGNKSMQKKNKTSNHLKPCSLLNYIIALIVILVGMFTLVAYHHTYHTGSNRSTASGSANAHTIAVSASINSSSSSGSTSSSSISSSSSNSNINTNAPALAVQSEYDGIIMCDWVLTSDSFSYINYKSLESLLNTYPKARVKVHIIAPNAANYYKYGDLLSKQQFHKYIKLGHDLEIVIRETVMEKKRPHMPFMPPPLGYKTYWLPQFKACCHHENVKDLRTQKKVPFHLYFYNRLVVLAGEGGLFSDFFHIHLRPLGAVEDLHKRKGKGGELSGAVLHTVCTCPPSASLSSNRIAVAGMDCGSRCGLSW
jgi:hypothetical protein